MLPYHQNYQQVVVIITIILFAHDGFKIYFTLLSKNSALIVDPPPDLRQCHPTLVVLETFLAADALNA